MRRQGPVGCTLVSVVVLIAGIALLFRIGTAAVQQGTKVTTTELARTTTTLRAPASVTADPARQLFDGGETVLTSDDFPAGSEVQMALCLSSKSLRAGLERACNERKLLSFVVDETGRFEVTLSVNIRFQAADGEVIDCGANDGYCSASLVSLDDPDLWAQVPLIFDPTDPRREINLPD